MSVLDRSQLSPFAIAVIRGHLGLAKVILEIADAQHLPTSQAPKRRKYEIVIDAEDSDVDSDDEVSSTRSGRDHGIGVRFDLVDEQHTIDDIRDVANTIKSTISPSYILRRDCNVSSFLGDSEMKFSRAFRSGVSTANSNQSYRYRSSTNTKKDLKSWQVSGLFL